MTVDVAVTSHAIDIGEVLETKLAPRFTVELLCWSLLLMAFEGYDMQVLAYAAPLIARDWSVPKGSLGAVFSAGLFGYLIGATSVTVLADRYGRRIAIIGGTVLFGSFTLGAVLTNSVNYLLIARLGAGLGLGASVPALLALNAEYTAVRSRACRITLLFVGYTLGGLAGGLVASQMMQAYGWRSVFLLGGLVPIALIVPLCLRLPESLRLLAVRAPKSPRLVTLLRRLLGDQTVTGADIRYAPDESSPGIPLRHLFSAGRAGMTLLLWLACISSLLGHQFLTSWLPTVLEGVGIPLSRAVIAGGLVMGGGAAGSLLIGPQMDRWGSRCVITLFILSGPLVAIIGMPQLPQTWLLFVVFLAGMCLIGGQVGLNAIVSNSYPTAIRSSGTGWALGVGRIGSITGPLIGGMLISNGTTTSKLLMYAGAPAFCCAIFVGLLSISVERHGQSIT
jgi:AAHS family 4-hydroxybenzoate transporter-like MFS transporter